jgi:hypothetical protein
MAMPSDLICSAEAEVAATVKQAGSSADLFCDCYCGD